jgi:hypothetical protein
MCKQQGTVSINSIDFEDNEIEGTCWNCNCEMEIELTPQSTMVLPEESSKRTIKNIKMVGKKEEGSMSEVKTETPSIEKAEELIKDEEVIQNEAEPVEKAEVEEVVVETIEEVVKEAEVEVKAEEAKQVEEAKKDMVECPNCGSMVGKDKMKKCGSEEASQDVLKQAIEKARAEGKVIGERRSFLGDYAKDMSDDDVLDAVKFENASLKKKVAELEASKEVKEVASITKKDETPLEIGSKDKQKSSEIDALASNVRKRAFSI